MKKSDMIVALLASVGVGAATFYTMSKSDKPLNKAVESVTPILSNMTTGSSSNTNQQSLGNNNNNKNHEKETMGTFGMS